MGLVELVGLLGISLVLVVMPASHRMSARQRMWAVFLGMYFVVQAVFFAREPSEFLYFQF